MNWYWVYSHWLVTYAEKQDTRRKNANKKRTIQTSICKFHRGANGNKINKLVNECDIVSTNFVHIFIVGPFKFISIGGRMDGGNWRWEEQPRVVFYFLSQVWLCVIFLAQWIEWHRYQHIFVWMKMYTQSVRPYGYNTTSVGCICIKCLFSVFPHGMEKLHGIKITCGLSRKCSAYVYEQYSIRYSQYGAHKNIEFRALYAYCEIVPLNSPTVFLFLPPSPPFSLYSGNSKINIWWKLIMNRFVMHPTDIHSNNFA